ncbi:MAG: penicillin-binding protein beta-lactamase class [Bacilli bacterium]|nr:penicillin-binding protein beta-lactamase class [Bacilli bacterium]
MVQMKKWIVVALAVLSSLTTATSLADTGSGAGSTDVFFSPNFYPADLTNGHVLQSSPYVVVSAEDPASSDAIPYISVMEYVGQFQSRYTGQMTVWKEEIVEKNSGDVINILPSVTMYSPSIYPQLAAPGDGQGYNFTSTGDSNPVKNPAWATGTGTNVTPVPNWNPTVPTTASGFADVSENNPYSPFITDLHNKGKIDGYGDGNFGPNDGLLRDQFVKMFVAALGVPAASGPAPWQDLPQWDVPYAQAAFAAGAIRGYSPTQFGAEDPITREQAAAVVWRWLSSKGVQSASGYDWAISDVSPEFSDDVRNILTHHLFGPQDFDSHGYHPQRPMTRQEAAALFDQAMQLQNQTLQQLNQSR